jgi:hypothetical protein
MLVRRPQRRVRWRYVMDKVVHEMFTIRSEVLREPDVRTVLLLREPASTIASILRVFPEGGEAMAVAHYAERLGELAAYARAVEGTGRGFHLTHRQLIERTDEALAALTAFLGLTPPLDERYRLTETTTQWGWGDTSPRILAGRVVRDEPAPGPALSPAAEDEAQAAYEACLAELARTTAGLGDVEKSTGNGPVFASAAGRND